MTNMISYQGLVRTFLNRTGYSRPRIYELIKLGVFPRKIKIGSRKVAFIESEINSWIQEKISSSTK
ncbi:AlpA family phage regulatory protein [Klebsiella pneumoniae]